MRRTEVFQPHTKLGDVLDNLITEWKNAHAGGVTRESDGVPAEALNERLATIADELKLALVDHLDYPLNDDECLQLRNRLEQVGKVCVRIAPDAHCDDSRALTKVYFELFVEHYRELNEALG